jgi:DNA-binding transcriptional LysR family regulator
MATLKTIAQLDLNLLKVLEALYHQRNMTRAAEQLNLTPSAVSHAVKRLRDALDDPLFERRGSQMRPTPLCRQVVPDVLDALNSLRQSLQNIGTFEPQTVSQRISLAVHEALEPIVFPTLFRHLHSRAPLLDIHSVKLDRQQLSMQLESGEVDFAVDVARPLASPVEHRLVSQTNFCVLSNKDNRSHARLTLNEYQQGAHITVSNRATGKVIEDIAFAQLGLNRDVRLRCQNYQTATELIKTEPLLLTLPFSIARTLVDDSLEICELPFSVPPVDTHLYWHTNARGDALLDWVRGELIEVFEQGF